MIEVLLATHNSEKYLRELMDSLLSQTLSDLRILVSDDGSTDGTKNIIRAYAGKNKNITLLKSNLPLGGAKENFFYLTGHADADYVLFADHDDVWLPNKAADTLAVMLEMEKAAGADTPLLVHTDLMVVDEELHTIAPSMMKAQKLSRTYNTLNRLLSQNHVTGCTVMANRALIGKVKYLDLGPVVMHDWWLALVASAFGRIGFLDKATIQYRQHQENEIGAVDTRSYGYLKTSLKNTERLKKRLFDTYRQAGEFYATYGKDLSEKNALIVRSYAEFEKINSCAKWARLFRFHYFKYGFVRKIGQLILG
jgi:glycosyltransferase involved in cell wall biosynthesis